MKRKIYETPQVETLEVSAEGIFCASNLEGQTEQYGVEDFTW